MRILYVVLVLASIGLAVLDNPWWLIGILVSTVLVMAWAVCRIAGIESRLEEREEELYQGICPRCGKPVHHSFPWFDRNPSKGGRPLHEKCFKDGLDEAGLDPDKDQDLHRGIMRARYARAMHEAGIISREEAEIEIDTAREEMGLPPLYGSPR